MLGVTSVVLDDRRERALLDQLERYYDAVPRHGARVEDFGPLTLFVREGQGWPFYARPARGWSGAVSVADVARVRVRQRELEIPESFEWVAETTPALRAAVEESGLVVHEHPLMVLDPGSSAPAVDEMSEDLSVRTLGPDNPTLPSALAVPHLAFAEPGTRIGSAGAAELAETVRDRSGDGSVDRVVARITTWMTVTGRTVATPVAQAGQHGAPQRTPVEVGGALMCSESTRWAKYRAPGG
ncbi:GNAT family N-acetyltransferase [Streptomyces lydicamycinicus]|uniref:GNAT family N-acetyltransferase n=1 Tax=Streptomyces lydicamycinicus TaxID=1546107 RepID=UPI003C2B3400